MENLEKVLVSRGERIVLQMLDKKYKWITRCGLGDLCVYEEKPEKRRVMGICDYFTDGDYAYACLEVFNHHFQFIQWDDEEPWLITDIINKCGVKFE